MSLENRKQTPFSEAKARQRASLTLLPSLGNLATKNAEPIVVRDPGPSAALIINASLPKLPPFGMPHDAQEWIRLGMPEVVEDGHSQPVQEPVGRFDMIVAPVRIPFSPRRDPASSLF